MEGRPGSGFPPTCSGQWTVVALRPWVGPWRGTIPRWIINPSLQPDPVCNSPEAAGGASPLIRPAGPRVCTTCPTPRGETPGPFRPGIHLHLPHPGRAAGPPDLYAGSDEPGFSWKRQSRSRSYFQQLLYTMKDFFVQVQMTLLNRSGKNHYDIFISYDKLVSFIY